MQREHFISRSGFILMTAGCAIGLGNIWRFPYTTGKYGGALFLLLYLGFLLLLGIPVMLMELSVGRAGQCTLPGSFRKLQNQKTSFKWHIPAHIFFTGNLFLLMFYIPITGWLMDYAVNFMIGNQDVFSPDFYASIMSSWQRQSIYMLSALILTFIICVGGVRRSVERFTKAIMPGLFILMIVLLARTLCQPDAYEGVLFFLKPDLSSFSAENFFETLTAAMAQAFFTLSIGIGGIAVCGSYIDRKRSLLQESLLIILLDTIVAIASGLIILPNCIMFGIDPGHGPSLVFVTLPKVFCHMPLGMFWGTIFFLFLVTAAMSTLVAVFENISAYGMDEFSWSRKKSCAISASALALLSMPCILGSNLLSQLHPLGGNSTVLDLEDFIVSQNFLPLGALFITIFCMSEKGWGADKFFEEVNAGVGWKLPRCLKNYIRFCVPAIIFFLWAAEIWNFFF